MLCAIISDIHANLEALDAVIAAIDSLPVDALYCLGDLVGYNADPDACVDMVLSRAKAVIRGNHDKAVAGFLNLDWFNRSARDAVLWTRKSILPTTLEKVRKLPEGPLELEEGLLLCHGTPYDEDAYLMDAGSAAKSFAHMAAQYPRARFCLYGHTHYPQVAVRITGRNKAEFLPTSEQFDLEPDFAYLINPGSIGQPRDGIARASFGILDTKRRVYRSVRVAYDVRQTQGKILGAGLPADCARRLAEGR